MSNRIKVYSIESRKGGVGKTTIALNLAKTLLNRGPVLLLDCDITGTSISEPANKSVYWQDVTNVLMEDEKTPKNLLGYFLNYYIRGRADISSFIPQDNILATKINIIGSEIYGDFSKAIVDTRLLMDEIHSFWLMEFIDYLIKTFEKRFETDDKPLHVIIDNSPGYVGFCQALHEYMYRLGPEKAKFLMVSSVDAQDLQSSLASSNEIYQAINGRLEMAAYFKSIIDGGQQKAGKEKFLDDNAELRDFFVKLSDDSQLLNNYICDVTSPSQYLSLILNKVPANLKENSISYTFSEVIGKENMPFFHEITSAKDDIPRTIIYYDEAISYQYYYRYLKVKEQKTADSKYDWTGRFKELNDKNNASALMTDRMEAVNSVDKLFKGLQTTLNNQGYTRILKALHPSWASSYAIERLNSVLKEIHQMAILEKDSQQVPLRILHNWVEGNLSSIQEDTGDSLEFRNLKDLVEYIEFPKGSDGSDRASTELYVLSIFLYATCNIIKRHKGVNSLKNFFLAEYQLKPFGRDWQDYIKDPVIIPNGDEDNTNLVRDINQIYFIRHFDDFYRAFCYAFLRMVDMHDDFDAVISAVRLYVPASSAIGFSKEMTDYLHNVIYRKTEQYDKNKLSAIKESYFAMTALQTVIRNHVIKNW